MVDESKMGLEAAQEIAGAIKTFAATLYLISTRMRATSVFHPNEQQVAGIVNAIAGREIVKSSETKGS